MFLQETHSKLEDESKWKDDFQAPIFFSHGTSNSCVVLIAYIGQSSIFLIKTLHSYTHNILFLGYPEYMNKTYKLLPTVQY